MHIKFISDKKVFSKRAKIRYAQRKAKKQGNITENSEFDFLESNIEEIKVFKDLKINIKKAENPTRP